MGHCGVMHLPAPIRAAVGLVATAADEARHLPDRALELPMLAVSTALQVSLRAQQRYAQLAARGDQVLNPTSAPRTTRRPGRPSTSRSRRRSCAAPHWPSSTTKAPRAPARGCSTSCSARPTRRRARRLRRPAALADAAAIEAAAQGHDNVTPIRKAAAPQRRPDAGGRPAPSSPSTTGPADSRHRGSRVGRGGRQATARTPARRRGTKTGTATKSTGKTSSREASHRQAGPARRPVARRPRHQERPPRRRHESAGRSEPPPPAPSKRRADPEQPATPRQERLAAAPHPLRRRSTPWTPPARRPRGDDTAERD